MRTNRTMLTILFVCFVVLVVVAVAAYLIGRYIIWPPYWDSGYTEGVPALTEEFRDASGRTWARRGGDHTVVFAHLMEPSFMIDKPLASFYLSIPAPALEKGKVYEADRVFTVIPPAGRGYRRGWYFKQPNVERPFRVRVLEIGEDGTAIIEIEGPDIGIRYPDRLELDRTKWII